MSESGCIKWPEQLPAPLITGKYDAESNSITNRMENGKTRQRRRFLCRRKVWEVEWLMREDQLALFEGFFEWDLAGGANKFKLNLPSPVTQQPQTYEAIIFESRYSAEAVAAQHKWRVTATLIIDHVDVIERQTYETITQIPEENTDDFQEVSDEIFDATNDLELNQWTS